MPEPEIRIKTWINLFNLALDNRIKEKTLYYYTMGEERWKKTDCWPPDGQKRVKWFFGKNFSLQKENLLNSVEFDQYDINFRATTGRNNRWWAPLGVPIRYDNRKKADQKLITYTSTPLEKDIEITGFPVASLFLSSTTRDGAIYVYLEDIDENGNIIFITDGHLRLIHRKIVDAKRSYKTLTPYHSFEKVDAEPMNPGEINEVKFGLHPTSVLIKKFHRLRIAIAGADKDTFPRYPSKGRSKIKIFRDRIHPSNISLPIISNHK
jgi:putative CocE/NonD family hydrolase